MQKIMEWLKKNKQYAVAGSALMVIIALIIVFVVKNGVTNDGNKREAALNAQYLNDQNYLSDCVIRIRESAGTLKGETAALDKVLSDAVKGRYEGNTSAKPGNGQLISAIVEANPNIDVLGNGFNKMLETINGCRTDFRGMQSKMLDMLKEYDQWRTGSLTVRTFGNFPSGNLEARVGNSVNRGKDAREQMFLIVTVDGTNTAFGTGKTQAEDPFAPTTTGG